MSDSKAENDYSEQPQSQADEDWRSGKLPPRAEILLQLLIQRLGKNENCWPSQEWLAEQMGVSRRTVQFWIAFLVSAGRIGIKRMSRTRRSRPRNHYFLLNGCEAQKPAPYDAQKPAPYDAQKPAPLSLDEFDSLEGESAEAENAPLPRDGEKQLKCKMPDALEHPRVEELLKKLQVLDAMPDEWKQRIEFEVTQESPLSNSTEQEFRMACAEMACAPPFWLRFLQFKVTFVKEAPGMPRDRARWDFFEKLERTLAKLDPTLEEMLFALEKLDEDPKRLRNDKDPRNFARNAYTFLPRYIVAERQYAMQRKAGEQIAAQQKARESPYSEPSATPVAPSAPLPICFDQFGDCADVARDICAKVNEDQFRMSFDGKVRFAREEGRLRIRAPNLFMKDWLSKKFGAEIRQAAAGFGLQGVDFIIEKGSS